MNPANFPNASGAVPASARPGQVQGTKNENAQVVMTHIAHLLQNQGPFSGWRAEVPVRDRAVKVYQLMSSLRLIQPRIDVQNAAQFALTFEQRAFREAGQRADYDKQCVDKLTHIRDTRARQAAVMQGSMVPPQGAPPAGMLGMGHNQPQGPFPPQMNRPVQASPIPGQRPTMPMGMGEPNQQAAVPQSRQPSQSQHPQQEQQPQQQQQQHHPQSQPPQNLLQQRSRARTANGVPLPDDLNTLSAQEYEHVCRLANQMLAKTSPEDMEKIKMNLQNMTPEQSQYLARKGIEPMTYFFRSQALSQLRRHKLNRMELARAHSVGIDPSNAAMMNDPMMNPQQRQILQNLMSLQRNSAFPFGAQQGFDPSAFIGNVENIQVQQADGLRSQEAGQLVVPASSSQMNHPPFNPNPQGVFPVGQAFPQYGQPNGPGISPRFLPQQQQQQQQHLPNASGSHPDSAQQAAQLQKTQSQAQTRMEAAQKAQMAMSSHAGQANSPKMSSQIPTQSPAMPMLNRPMPPAAQISPQQSHVRPSSGPPGIPQQPVGVPPFASQPSIPGRPQIPPNLPPGVQEQLARLTPDQLKAFLMSQHQQMLANQARANAAAAQSAMPMQESVSGQGQQAMNGRMGNGQNLRASMGFQQQQQQQSISGMGGPEGQIQHLPGQQPSAQRQQPQAAAALTQQQQQQRQNDFQRLQILRQQSAGMEMTPEQVRDMDRLHFPPSILNTNPNMNSPVPKNIRTWGQLKQWAAENPHILGDLPKLMTLQKLHLAQVLDQGKDISNRKLDQNGHVLFSQGMPHPFMNPQNLASGQQPPMGMPPMRPITDQDLQMARQRYGPQLQHVSDDQLREVLHKSRQKQIMQAQARAYAAQNLMNKTQQAQAQAQTQAPQATPVTQSISPPKPPTPTQPPTTSRPAQQQTRATPAPVPAPAKGAKGTTGKQGSKKRKGADEPVEVQNTTTAAAAAVPTMTQSPAASSAAPVTVPARPNIPFTREQIAAMSPQQRAQLEAHMRRQQRAPISRVTAEESWSHLPEKIQQLYNDIQKNAPATDPVAVSSEQKAAMSQQLCDCTDMLARMDALVQWFARFPGQEKTLRSLLAMRVQLMRQFKPGMDWTLNDDFTISPEHLMGTINYVKRLFHAMITKVNQHQNQPSAQRPALSQGAALQHAAAAQQANSAMPALNATNLQQLQQQEEALQRARRASSQATSIANAVPPPAPFGAPSPSGVPHAYGPGPGGFTPEKLRVPPNKKRRQSHSAQGQGQGAGTTPASSKSQAPKQTVAQTKPPFSAVVGGRFKCEVAECQHHYQGFATQKLLDEHVQESHKVEEPIENALDFALESFEIGLIKENGKAPTAQMQQSTKKKAGVMDDHTISNNNNNNNDQAPATATNKQLATSTPPVKNEMTPTSTGGTPVNRVTSQAPAKSTSPASNQQLTPVPSASGRIPTSQKPTAAATVADQNGTKVMTGKNQVTTSAEGTGTTATATKDHWTDSPVSLEAIHDALTDFRDNGLQGLGNDPVYEFLNSDMFDAEAVDSDSKDTPDSADTWIATATRTPKDNEVPLSSKADMEVKIGDGSDENDSWMNSFPADWVNVPSRFEADGRSSPFGVFRDEVDWVPSVEQKGGGGDGETAVYAV